MLLRNIIGRTRLTVLGLNTGTSADGLDLGVIRISRNAQKKRFPTVTFLAGTKKKFGPKLRESIHRIADSRSVDLEEMIYLDNLLGTVIGRKAAEYLTELKKKRINIDIISSHGQTVRHLPQKVSIGGEQINGTLQLGSLDQIAAHTRRIVVGNFRQADIAAGGEGAPITIGAMYRIFAEQKSRLIVNIGGIANYFYLPPLHTHLEPQGGDCGPGNCLCDLLAQKLYDIPFDRNGVRASRGTIDSKLLSKLKNESFFTNRTVSTGREVFGPQLVEEIVRYGNRNKLLPDDLMASAAELTVYGISRSVHPIVKKDPAITQLYLTGGGRYNKFFLKRLTYHLPEVRISVIDELGINGDYVEAASYAVLGEACLRSETSRRSNSGRKKFSAMPILGHIAQPPEAA